MQIVRTALNRCGQLRFKKPKDESYYACFQQKRGLCKQTEMASSCQGNDGCAIMIGMSGKSTATSSISIGAPYFNRTPPPPRCPAPMPLWPTLLWYFFADVMFGVMAYLTNSILPGIVIHGMGLLIFFVLVWPADQSRRLVAYGGGGAWFCIHTGQAIVFTTLEERIALTRISKRSADQLSSLAAPEASRPTARRQS